MTMFWSLILAFLAGTIVYLNVTKFPYNIDTDFIAEVNYSRAVWEYRSLFPEEWICANELMFFRPTVLAALLYGMAGKYILSYALALCVTLVFILVSVNQATVGIYNFKHGADFVKYAYQMIEKNNRVQNEFYVAPVYNEMIEDGKKIIYADVGNNMYGTGTPEDLNLFMQTEICRRFMD